jgi:hypothetical protein
MERRDSIWLVGVYIASLGRKEECIFWPLEHRPKFYVPNGSFEL